MQLQPFVVNFKAALTCSRKCIDEKLALAVEAFGNEPEATNLWIGDDRAVSSLHKDFYENMYVNAMVL